VRGREALGDAASGAEQPGSSSAPYLVAHLDTPLASKADKVREPVTSAPRVMRVLSPSFAAVLPE